MNKEPFNSNMLSRKDFTQKYISIKEQKQKKYDNNITIIIYIEIRFSPRCILNIFISDIFN